MFAAATVVAFALVSSVLADPSPLTPGTSNAGGDCVISWSPDPTGTWTQTNIELMTGDNWNMVHLTTVATVDTTSGAATTFTWTCPEVEPNSAIYFYQFSHAAQPTNLLWSTRWAIADSTGGTVPAENQTQPDGTNIPWGIGRLVDPSIARPAPSYITGQTSQPGTGGAGTGTGAVSSAASASGAVSTPASSARPSSMVRTTPSATNIRESATSSAGAAASTSSNAAGSHRAPLALGALAAIAGFMALA